MSAIYPWQQAAWDSLCGRLATDKLPHALLLHGQKGVGKWDLAECFAQLLLCEDPAKQQQPCGNCRSCQLFNVGNHPDYTVIAPEEAGKQITIGMIRELSTRLTMSSQYGGYKVVIITPAEQMNVASANSLLKTLEEPTDNTVLILLASQLDRLLPTIRSRCQKMLLAAHNRQAALDWLSGQESVAAGQAKQLLSLAQGAPLLALEMANAEILTQRAELIEVLEQLGSGRMGLVEAASTCGQWPLDEVIQWLEHWVMDMIRLKFSDNPVSFTTPDVAQQLQRYAAQIDLVKLYGYFDKLVEANRLTNTQINGQLLLENTLTGWVRLFSKQTQRGYG